MRIQSSGVPGPGAVELVLAEECSHSHRPDEILHLQGVTMTQIRFVVPVFCLGLMMFATQVPQVRAQQNETLTGEWEVTSVELGIRSTVRLQLTESGNVLNGKLYDDGEHIEVKETVNGPQVRLEDKVGINPACIRERSQMVACPERSQSLAKTTQEPAHGRQRELRWENLRLRGRSNTCRRTFTGSFPRIFPR